MCCGCADGMGGDNFEKLMTMGTPREIEQYLSGIPPKESIPEQWNVQVYVRALKKHTVIPVSYTHLDVYKRQSVDLALFHREAQVIDSTSAAVSLDKIAHFNQRIRPPYVFSFQVRKLCLTKGFQHP